MCVAVRRDDRESSVGIDIQSGHCLSLKMNLFFVQSAQEISNQLHTKNDVC